MNDFFANVPLPAAQRLEQLSRLAYELREDAARVLAAYGTRTPSELLARIQAGEVAEHPAYDDYLGARIIADAREAVRAELAGVLRECGG